MHIQFSRHAKRRLKLYKIAAVVVFDILQEIDLSDGQHQIIRKYVGFEYPIKIVISVRGNEITVITAYPLKRGKKNESSL